MEEPRTKKKGKAMEVTILLIYSNETSCDIDVRIALRANTWWEQALGH